MPSSTARPTEIVRFLQIWIEPDRQGVPPSYEEKRFEPHEKVGRLRLIASPDGHEGSVILHQDAYVYAGLFDGHQRAEHALRDRRRAYVHVVRGEIDVNGERLEGGDAAKLSDVSAVRLANGSKAEVLLFDLP